MNKLGPLSLIMSALVYAVYVYAVFYVYVQLCDAFLPADAPANRIAVALTNECVVFYTVGHVFLKDIRISEYRTVGRRVVSVNVFIVNLGYFVMRPSTRDASWMIFFIMFCRQVEGTHLHLSRGPSGDCDLVCGAVTLVTSLLFCLVAPDKVGYVILLCDMCYMLVLDYLECKGQARHIELMRRTEHISPVSPAA
jgi:hypothetical protein